MTRHPALTLAIVLVAAFVAVSAFEISVAIAGDAMVTDAANVDVAPPDPSPPPTIAKATPDPGADWLVDSGAIAAVLSVPIQVSIALLARSRRIRGAMPWITRPWFLAVVAILIADVVAFWPRMIAGDVTLTAAVLVVGAHVGQIMRPYVTPAPDEPAVPA